MALRFSIDSLAVASAKRPWLVIAAWAAVLVASVFLIATLLSGVLSNEQKLTNNPDSERAFAILEDWRGERHDDEVIVVRSGSLTVDDPPSGRRSRRSHGVSAPTGHGTGRHDYYIQRTSRLFPDRHTTILPLVMAGDEEEAQDNIDNVLAVTGRARAGTDFEVLIAGNASIYHEMQELAASDLQTGEMIGIPIALAVLIIVFGSFTAALIPVVLAIFSIIIAVGLTAIFGQAFQFSFFVTNVITMMGLAVGIDYSLFIVSRFREERERGHDKLSAVRATAQTASSRVFFSGRQSSWRCWACCSCRPQSS
jgi:RND superfamily putative drug exporter